MAAEAALAGHRAVGRAARLPGFANAHSHAFHRALRGRTHAGGGYVLDLARCHVLCWHRRLNPDNYLVLARAVYAEMTLAGITTVGEFHYVHHGPGGQPYADPNAMGHALQQAARDAGIRLTLLDACYLEGGLGAAGHLPLDELQLRFSDKTVDAWASRAGDIDAGPGTVSARPSTRCGPSPGMTSPGRRRERRPPAARSPFRAARGEPLGAGVLRAHPHRAAGRRGALTPRTTVVHATHLTDGDIQVLGGSRSCACFCPSTEAFLADGIGPAAALASACCPLSLGSDSHAVVDLLMEARLVELGERLQSGARGHFDAAALAAAACGAGHACLGWPEAGEIVPGAVADLVTVRLDTPRLAGATPGSALASVIFAGTAADVSDVVISGRDVVRDGQHRLVPDVPAALAAAIRPLLT